MMDIQLATELKGKFCPLHEYKKKILRYEKNSV